MVEKKETVAAPQIDGFRIKGKLTGSLKQLADTLRSITFLEVAQEKDAVEAAYVEKRDIDKNPYLFSILRIDKQELEVTYSIPPGIAPRRRRVDVILYLLNVLSVIEPDYQVDRKLTYQLIEDAVKQLTQAITPEYAKLYTAYDTLNKEADDLRQRATRLGEQNEALTTRNFELKTKNDELRIQVGEAITLSNSSLKARLQEWVEEHHGEVNIFEFCKVHKVSEGRAEEMLNQMVNEGYLEVVK